MSIFRPSVLALPLLAALLLASTPAPAKHYILSQGKIQFEAPDAWPAIMEKTNGDPQFYVFQVPNPASGDTLTHVTVTTHQLVSVMDFDAFVEQTFAGARQSAGFSQAATALASDHGLHYFFYRDNQRQDVRLSIFQHGHVAVVLRCQHPSEAKADKQWLTRYRATCAKLAQHLDL